MSMEIEYLSEEQLAARLRAMYQRVETEVEKLRNLMATVLIVNGPMELPADLPKDFTKGWTASQLASRSEPWPLYTSA